MTQAVPDLRRAAAMAYRVLAARKIRQLPVDPLPILRACRDTCVYTAVEAADVLQLSSREAASLFTDADALTWRFQENGKMRYITIYRPDGNPARLRFTLAHELGHRLLNHEGSTLAEEREADCFASHLLCPEPALRRMADQCRKTAPERIATAFYVSRACACTLALREPAGVDNDLWDAVDLQLADAVDAFCRTKAPKTPE